MWKIYLESPTCSYENGKYLESIVDNLAITCDEIRKQTKTIPTNFSRKNIICETKNFYIVLTFSLITIALLVLLLFTFAW